MSNIKAWIVWVGCVVLLVAGGTLAHAQQQPDDTAAGTDTDAAATESDAKKKKLGLFVGVAAGMASIEELNTTIVTFDDIYEAPSTFVLDDQLYARASIGWRLAGGRGDFRGIYKGYKEDTFDFQATGLSSRIVQDQQVTDGLAEWWKLRAGGGKLASSRSVRYWSPAFDVPPSPLPPGYSPTPQLGEVRSADCDVLEGAPFSPPPPGFELLDATAIEELQGLCGRRLDPIQVGQRFGLAPNTSIADPDQRQADYLQRLGDFFGLSAADANSLNVASFFPESLNNRLQHFDVLYGREFGGRRFSSHWWGGFRYFEYTGQVAGAAWLVSPSGQEGIGFTDGSFLRLLLMHQETTGFGPTGAWEVDFNFFNRTLQVFLNFQAAFIFADLSSDSGQFLSIVNDGATNMNSALVSTRISQNVTKSVWQNTAEAGVRLNFKNGIQVEAGYSVTGYLDTFLLPNRIFIPQGLAQRDQPITALFASQDYDVDLVYGGVNFQF